MYLHKSKNMSTGTPGTITHEEGLQEIKQTGGKPKFNIGELNRQRAAERKAAKEAEAQQPPTPGTTDLNQLREQQKAAATPPPPQQAFDAFKQPPPQPAKVVKKKREAPSQYIFRFVKPPDKKLWDGKVSASTHLVNSFVVNYPYHVLIDAATGLPSYKPVDIRDEKTDVARGYEEGTIIFQPRTVRYIAAEKSLFVDEQEAGREQMFVVVDGRNRILDNQNNREHLKFTKYEKRVEGSLFNLVMFLHMNNQCANQHPMVRRYGTTKPLYEMLDFGQMEENKISRGKLKQKMYELACTARDAEMIPHAKYLNIPFVIPETHQRRDMDAVREDYKDYALANPEHFEKTFSDPKVKIIHMIVTAAERDELGIGKIVAGQAHWMRSRKLIGMIPPDRNPYEYLAEFMLTAEGAGFAGDLKAWWSLNQGV